MTVNISVPKAWNELSQQQLRFLFLTIVKTQAVNKSFPFRSSDDAAAQIFAQICTLCLFVWANFKPVCKFADGWLVRHDGQEFVLSSQQIAAAISHLSWIKEIPSPPVRLDMIDGASAVRADISEGFPFDFWLSCEALWQGYIASQNNDCLKRMAAILYRKPDIALDDAECLSIFYWWAAVKNMTSLLFPHFFKPDNFSSSHSLPSQNDIRISMDAQIRALTKGDITKEKEILSLETIRALTELDALAREYDELNKKFPKR